MNRDQQSSGNRGTRLTYTFLAWRISVNERMWIMQLTECHVQEQAPFFWMSEVEIVETQLGLVDLCASICKLINDSQTSADAETWDKDISMISHPQIDIEQEDPELTRWNLIQFCFLSWTIYV
jgi:hypothetical protein